MTIPVAMFATDLDGTLLDADGDLPAVNRRAIRATAAAGVPFVVATGRPLRWLNVLDDLPVHPWVVAANGALIWDIVEHRLVAAADLDPQIALEAAARLQAAIPGLSFGIETPEGFGCEPVCPVAGRVGQVVVATLPDLIASGPVLKLLGFHESLPVTELSRLASAALDGLANPTFSMAGGHYSLLEISAAAVSKASALERVCVELGIEADAVAAFGDMPNDLDMLRWVGRPHVVADAHHSMLCHGFTLVGPAGLGGVGRRVLDLLA